MDDGLDIGHYITWVQREAMLDRLHKEMGGSMNQPETPGPALYGTLLERAIEPSMKGVEATLKEDGEWFARQIKKDVDAALRRVYAEGVRHGFQQGVEAESKRRGD